MTSRIVHHAYRPKRPPRKRKAAALAGPATHRTPPTDTPPVVDEPEPTPPPANDDTRTKPAPPAAKSAIVTNANRKQGKLLRAERAHDDDPEADARVRAFLKRMIRPGGALPPEKP